MPVAIIDPGAQLLHELAPIFSCSIPAAHDKHIAEPTDEYLPTEQYKQKVESTAPADAEYFPPPQLEQAELASPGEYCPIGHRGHDLPPPTA